MSLSFGGVEGGVGLTGGFGGLARLIFISLWISFWNSRILAGSYHWSYIRGSSWKSRGLLVLVL
jgi:hypothetical protein